MNAPPLTITGPAALVEAVPYLLGFTPTDSLVIVGLAANTVAVTARVDLDGLSPKQITELACTLRDKADATAMIALIYGPTADPEPVASAARAAGLQLAEHLRVDQGRYWSLTCPLEGCCPAQGRPIPQAGPVAAEFVLNGHAPLASRDDLAVALQPDDDKGQCLTAELERVRAELADELATAGDILLGADNRPDRRWTDAETVCLGVALSGYPVRDAAWMAIEDGSLDGRDLFAHLARTLPAGHRAPALFLFAWKTWRLGHGALASIAVNRALDDDPNYSAARLLEAALTKAIDPRRMPQLELPS
jgi:hypothetical protein